MPFFTSTTEWVWRTGTVSQCACPNQSMLCVWHTPLPPWTTYCRGVALKSFIGSSTWVLSPQLQCTRKEGAGSMSTSLSSQGCSWSEHTRLVVYARGMDGSNSAAFFACLQKGKFEHNMNFNKTRYWQSHQLP